MPYKVKIIRTEDNKESFMNYDYEWDSDYWWSEGNMSCDCNRYLEFERGLRNNPNVKKVICSKIKYKIEIKNDNGEILYTELLNNKE